MRNISVSHYSGLRLGTRQHSQNRASPMGDRSFETETDELDPATLSPWGNWTSRLGSGMGKRIPKIKVCHKNEEFNVLTAMMDQLNQQKVV